MPEEPYLWRYRETDRHGEYIDMLLLPMDGEETLLEDTDDPEAGETTIVTWGGRDA